MPWSRVHDPDFRQVRDLVGAASGECCSAAVRLRPRIEILNEAAETKPQALSRRPPEPPPRQACIIRPLSWPAEGTIFHVSEDLVTVLPASLPKPVTMRCWQVPLQTALRSPAFKVTLVRGGRARRGRAESGPTLNPETLNRM